MNILFFCCILIYISSVFFYFETQDAVTIMESEQMKEAMSKEIAKGCEQMKGFEKPLKWIYSLEPFTQENQYLTPKMSLRRNNILKDFMPKIEKMYEGKSGVNMKDYGLNMGGNDE